MVRLRTFTPPLSSDAFRVLRKTVMPSESSTSSSSESDSSVSRRSRRSRRERRPAQDRPDRSRSPRRGSRAPDEAEQERLERERRERSRERLERIVEEDRLRKEQSEERRAQQNQPRDGQPADGQQPADDQLGDRQPVQPPGQESKQFKFMVARKRMKVFRDWMTTSLSAPEARNLRDSFIPSFPNSGFDLVMSSFSRRFKDIKTPEMSKAEATEWSLKAEQYKILDVARLLLFLREKTAESADLKDSPLAEAADTALRLWGHTFHNVTTSRRENLLKVSDPKILSLLKEPHRFKPRDCASLFGRHFIKNMVKEATDDQTLRIITMARHQGLERAAAVIVAPQDLIVEEISVKEAIATAIPVDHPAPLTGAEETTQSDSGSKINLSWWVANLIKCNGKPMLAVDPDLTIYSDASNSGSAIQMETGVQRLEAQDVHLFPAVGTVGTGSGFICIPLEPASGAVYELETPTGIGGV
ncbi:LOW QUALITY PROTEIN: hypothetical protein DAPPUDRAFT_249800 [Daphnia pulex]|uniref:Uncharacterized protein n=1 Tax=Daphnia pulex TaxID=6669 RepID=E9GXB5_DAPPU|nr:LOW QUALITY PROTEIN: hypothetical protein DAPPUDRAFT_249800 [Daphnia pulex]|eukprot:EFX75891.1 LOW QUALITY PROTEIN: hypothetical protein DAPPUDRAFT_249800 [Daphnia pulex]